MSYLILYKNNKACLNSVKLFCCIFFCLFLPVHANIKFEHISLSEQLTTNGAQFTFQDSKGFIWIATNSGLTRFDGYDFKIFDEKQSVNSISSNLVTTVAEDHNGNLWVGTRGGGLNKFDPKTEQFKQFKHSVTDNNTLNNDIVMTIKVDDLNNIWVGTFGGGVSYYNQSTKHFSHFVTTDNKNSLSNNNVVELIIDDKNNLWIGTFGGGLDHFNLNTQFFTNYASRGQNSLSSNKVMSLLQDSSKNIWVGTQGGGLNLFNSTTKTFTHYVHNEQDLTSISSNNVKSIIEADTGELWVGTWRGLNQLNIKTQQFKNYKNVSTQKDSLSDNEISHIMKDTQNNIWVATFNNGLNLFNPKTRLFNHNRIQIHDAVKSINAKNITGFLFDSKNNLWLASNSGVLRINQKSGFITEFNQNDISNSGLSNNDVRSIIEDKNGDLWFGIWEGGLSKFNPLTNQFTHFSHKTSDKNSLSDNKVRTIFQDSLGKLWIGTFGGGLNHFDPLTNQFVRYQFQKDNLKSISSNFVGDIQEDSNGNIWIATTEGLNLFNPITKAFIHYKNDPKNMQSLSHNMVADLFLDQSGKLWVGTSNGLNAFNKSDQTFTRYMLNKAASSEMIYSIEQSDDGNLWVSTNQGITRFSHKTHTFKKYNNADGLQSNDFNLQSSIKNKDGYIFFGGENGFNRFKPDKIIDEVTKKEAVITEMSVLNEPITIVSNSDNSNEKNNVFTLENSIHNTKAITLDYTDNLMSFKFSTLHYFNNKKQMFAYQLVGWDKYWIYTDSKNRKATYSNLPHGKYTFKVKASDDNGNWHNKEVELAITILPPLWKTWWAYSIYTIIAFILVLYYLRVQRNKINFERSLNIRLEQKVVERTEELTNTNNKLSLLNEQLEEASLTDQLTGMKNRRFLKNNLQNDIKLIIRKHLDFLNLNNGSELLESDLIFFLIDLDHFKQVNDTHGHTAGDLVLVQIKLILEKVFRETDYLVRWGGEEFLVVARFTNRENAPELSERLRKEVEEHNFDIGKDITLSKTCSIGFSCFPFIKNKPEALTWEQAVDIADHCLYAAKNTSRNAWVGLTNESCSEESLFNSIIENTKTLTKSNQLSVVSSCNNTDIKWN